MTDTGAETIPLHACCLLDRPLVVLEDTEPDPAHDWSHLTKYSLGIPVDQLLDNWQRILEAAHTAQGEAIPI